MLWHAGRGNGGRIMGDSFEQSSPTQPYAQRRTVPRYSFIATVDIVEPVSDVRISGRISEISRKGCYVDILNTLPKDTPVRVLISRDRGSFSSEGKIIYVQEQMGMGIAFLDPPANQLSVLDEWLGELSRGQ
jgi:PilZ domain